MPAHEPTQEHHAAVSREPAPAGGSEDRPAAALKSGPDDEAGGVPDEARVDQSPAEGDEAAADQGGSEHGEAETTAVTQVAAPVPAEVPAVAQAAIGSAPAEPPPEVQVLAGPRNPGLRGAAEPVAADERGAVAAGALKSQDEVTTVRYGIDAGQRDVTADGTESDAARIDRHAGLAQDASRGREAPGVSSGAVNGQAPAVGQGVGVAAEVGGEPVSLVEPAARSVQPLSLRELAAALAKIDPELAPRGLLRDLGIQRTAGLPAAPGASAVEAGAQAVADVGGDEAGAPDEGEQDERGESRTDETRQARDDRRAGMGAVRLAGRAEGGAAVPAPVTPAWTSDGGPTGTAGPATVSVAPAATVRPAVLVQSGVMASGAPDSAGQAREAALAQAVRQQAASGLTAALTARGGSVTLRLQPESLGALRIEVGMVGAGVSVSFEAASGRAREIIDRALPDLRASLEERGLRVDDMTVRIGSDSGGGRAGHGGHHGDAGTPSGGAHGAPGWPGEDGAAGDGSDGEDRAGGGAGAQSGEGEGRGGGDDEGASSEIVTVAGFGGAARLDALA